MTTVELHLDDPTYERVKHIAAGCRMTVEALIQDLIQRLVAIETTSTRAEGGKSPRSAGPRSVLQPRKTVPDESPSPQCDGSTVAPQLCRNLQIRWAIRFRGP